MELIDASIIEIFLDFLHAAEGGKSGVEAGFLEIKLILAQFGGELADPETFTVGLDGADGGAHIDHDALLELLEAAFFAAERGDGLGMAGFLFAKAPWHGEGEIDLPRVAVAIPYIGGSVAGGTVLGV